MAYEEVKKHLEKKEIELDDLEETEGLLSGFKKADLDDIEIKDEDIGNPNFKAIFIKLEGRTTACLIYI